MKRSVIQRGVWSAGVVLCGTLSGCAVLSVDVDVYKGALVNEDHVQLHQLVALATAAKPMLVQLRDSIEWPSEEMPTKTFKDNRSWYEAGYVTPPTPPVPPVKDWFCKRADVFCRDPVEQLLPTGGRFCQWFEWFCPITEYQFFRNTMAVNVNVVLGLYEELDGDGQKVRRVLPGETRGLTGLTEGYQYASRMADQATGSTDKSIAKNAREQAEHRLIDALVEFATKVLFLANHEGLASPPGTPGLILGGVEKLSRGLMGDFLTDKSMYTFFNSGLAETKKQQYVRVLQAVGNSILFSANELRERNRYEYESRRKVDAEVTAANSVFSPNPRKVVEDLLQELQQEKEQAQKQLVEATARRDDLKSELGQDTPASGLHTLLRDASTEVSKTQKSLDEYRIQTHPIESLHRLLSKEVREEIRAQFEKSGKEDASPPDDFLHALTIALNSRQTTRNGTLTQEETEQFFEAIRSVGDLKTKEAFKAERLWKEYTSTKLTLLFDEFVVYLDRLERQRDRGVKQYEKARDEKKQRRQEVMGTIAQLTDELKKVERLIAQLPKDIDRFETAKGVIAEVTTAVVNDAESAQQFVSPNTVYTLLALHVDRKITAADSGRQQRYRDAQDDLSRRTPPHGRSQLKANDYKSPLAVMDEVIAFLRHQQMNAMARFGKNSEQDKKATEASESAYQHRAGMVDIRQSSSYPQTSYPSTSRQVDPNFA